MTALVYPDKTIIQESPYIEHGPYIEMVGLNFFLHEIPFGGGEVSYIGAFGSLQKALEMADSLT
jgi:hypothetical protein